ncbi:MAG TPA: carboxymuconolactone decarboxylase family protein [Planctomycetota bacterium]
MPPRIPQGLLALARLTAAAVRGRERDIRRELVAALAEDVDVHRLHETLLQVVPFAGYGRAINAFAVLDSLRPDRPFRLERGTSKGDRLCRRIYGPSYGPLMRRLNALHPDLASWILRDGYGRVLSRGGLTIVERELLAVAALAALDGLEKQLESHVRGARRVGASEARIRAVLRAVR